MMNRKLGYMSTLSFGDEGSQGMLFQYFVSTAVQDKGTTCDSMASAYSCGRDWS